MMIHTLLLTTILAAPAAEKPGDVQASQRPHDRWLACPMATKPVTIDGKLDEWDVQNAPIVISVNTVNTRGVLWPSITDDADGSSRCAVRWDAKYLYLMIRATDDKLIFRPETRRQRNHNFDSMQIYLAPSGQGLDSARYPTDISMRCVFHPTSMTEVNMPLLPAGSKAAFTVRPDGYDAEVAIAWAGLKTRPLAGDRVKFTLLQVDSDSPLGTLARAAKLWGQMAWVWHQSGHGAQPRHWCDLRLMGPVGVGGDLIAGQAAYAVGQPVTFKAQLDTTQAGFTAKAVVVRQGDRIVATVPVDRPLKADETLLLSGTVNTRSLKPGDYQMLVACEGPGGRRGASGQASFSIVAGALEAPKPRVTVALSAEESRYGSQGAAVHPARVVTKQDYLEFVEVVRGFTEARVVATIRNFKPPKGNTAGASASLVSQAQHPALWYAIWKDEKYAKLTLDYFRAAHDMLAGAPKSTSQGFTYLPAAVSAYGWIKDSPSLTAADHAWIRAWLVRAAKFQIKNAERGAMNRAQGTSLGLSILTNWYPDLPERMMWRSYADAVWQDWREFGDSDENSIGYNALSLDYKFRYVAANRLADRGFYKDPAIRNYMERFLHQMAPMGATPLYGDSIEWGLNHAYIHIFETLATAYRDGRYKWAAHRAMEHWQERLTRLKDFHLDYIHGSQHIGRAYLVADDSIPATPPKVQSQVLKRRAARHLTQAETRDRMMSMVLLDEWIPDKVVLKSGQGKRDMFALVGACRPLGHNGDDITAFHGLVDQGSVLLSDQGYMQRASTYHNMVTIEDLEGVPPSGGHVEESVPEFFESDVATYCTIQAKGYLGYPVTLRRSIAFVKNHCVVVRDALTFHEPFKCRVFPTWTTRRVGPKVGPNWANTHVDTLITRGIFNPVVYSERHNPAYDLLVYFSPRTDRQMRITMSEPGTHVPVRVQQVWSGLPAKGQTLVFTTVLLPHSPVADPNRLAAGIEVTTDTDEKIVLKVSRPGKPDTLVIMNDTPKPIQLGRLKPIARFGCVLDPDGAAPKHVFWRGNEGGAQSPTHGEF